MRRWGIELHRQYGGTLLGKERGSVPLLPPGIKLSCGHRSSAQRIVWRKGAG